MPRTFTVIALALAIAGIVTPAHAAAGHTGEPLSTIPPLRDGFGPVDITEVTTTPNGKVGAPGCDAHGAAAYAITLLDERARLTLEIGDLDGNGLCAVGLYRQRIAGETLTDLYDIAGRAAFTHDEVACTGGCSVAATLGRNTHYLVIWPAGSGAVERRASIRGALRGLTSIDASLSGTPIGGCRRIDRGAFTSLAVGVSPPPASPDAHVLVERVDRARGTRTDLGTLSLGPDGRATSQIESGARGYHDVLVTFPGSATAEPRTVRRCLIVRGPAKATIEPRRFRFAYDDYAVWRHGDRVVLRVEIGPENLARGTVNLRFERNIGNHRYRPFEVRRGVRVVDGVAIFRMRATYRSNGLPFYRVRAEWPGSNTYRATKSPWICIQFNR